MAPSLGIERGPAEPATQVLVELLPRARCVGREHLPEDRRLVLDDVVEILNECANRVIAADLVVRCIGGTPGVGQVRRWAGEHAGSITLPDAKVASPSVSRILSRTTIHLGASLPVRSRGLPGT